MADVLKYGGAYMRRLGELFGQPSRAFRRCERDTISPLQFFLGSYFGGYLTTVAFVLTYLSIYFRPELTLAIRERFGSFIGILSGAFGLYASLGLIAAITTGAVTWGVYRLFGSTAQLEAHLGVMLQLSFLEPFVGWVVTLAIFIWDAGPFSRVDFAIVSETPPYGLFLAAGTYLVSRVWYLVVGYKGLHEVHGLNRVQKRIAFWFGFVPFFFMWNVLVVAYTWLVVVILIIGGD